jgi:hypothetical protein
MRNLRDRLDKIKWVEDTTDFFGFQLRWTMIRNVHKYYFLI